MRESEFQFNGSLLNQKTLFDHPSGLFVLFFTEMWERFSYYGMRAILVLFLTSALFNDGWGWERKDALVLYGWYTGLVYFTPLIGGFIADKFLGYKLATILGALTMSFGHGFLAMESFSNLFFFAGLTCLILGNGLFKPNINSIVGQLYKDKDIRKDSGYTIFYMGINCGAFLGILLCGYLGEKIGWHIGFGLAGIFMFFGLMQFWFAQSIFGKIGRKPNSNNSNKYELELSQKITRIEWDRIFVIIIFSFATIFFWWAFEQAGGSMTIFAKDYTSRNLYGNHSLIFKLTNTLITIVPLIVMTYVLAKLFSITYKKILTSNFFLGFSFVLIWIIILWMIKNEFNSESTEIPASWFSVLNSLFIIIFAPIFSKIWSSNLNISGPVKFAIGLVLLGIGFGFLSYGSLSIPFGAKTAQVSIFWLIFAYLFHTLGELCISPVGLSYISKLAPLRLVGLMFGFWYLSSAFANYLGGITGSYIDKISNISGLSGFFLIFTLLPIFVGFVIYLFRSSLIKKMHGYV